MCLDMVLWVGELADGFGLWSEETPPTVLSCSIHKGAGREPWFLSRNGTSNCDLSMMRVKSLTIQVGTDETAVLQSERANRRR